MNVAMDLGQAVKRSVSSLVLLLSVGGVSRGTQAVDAVVVGRCTAQAVMSQAKALTCILGCCQARGTSQCLMCLMFVPLVHRK